MISNLLNLNKILVEKINSMLQEIDFNLYQENSKIFFKDLISDLDVSSKQEITIWFESMRLIKLDDQLSEKQKIEKIKKHKTTSILKIFFENVLKKIIQNYITQNASVVDSVMLGFNVGNSVLGLENKILNQEVLNLVIPHIVLSNKFDEFESLVVYSLKY